MTHKNPILISGAGIAGLSAALCLSRAGFQVEVVEKAKVLEPIGAGIQISPNAYRILDGLGLGQRLESVATYPNSILVRDGISGKIVTSLPLGKTILERFGHPYCVIHRGDFQNLLVNACQEEPFINMRFGTTIKDFKNQENLSSATLHNGEQIAASMLVLADGIWSELRTGMLELLRPTFSGKVAWRTLIPANKIRNNDMISNTNLWLAPRTHVVSYPVRAAESLNVIVIADGDSEVEQKPEEPQKLKTGPTGFKGELYDLIQLSDDWSAWPIFESPSPVCLARDRIALIGDAAHAMLPFAAQGAAMAIEDAAELANCLVDHTPQDAIEIFEARRHDRVTRVGKLARANGRIYHLPWPLNICRNIAMRLIPPQKLLERQAWVYDWEPGG